MPILLPWGWLGALSPAPAPCEPVGQPHSPDPELPASVCLVLGGWEIKPDSAEQHCTGLGWELSHFNYCSNVILFSTTLIEIKQLPHSGWDKSESFFIALRFNED